MVDSRSLIAGLVLILACGVAGADDDHLKARRLHEAGDILAMEQILKQARQRHPGRILEVELEEIGGRLVYEIELVDSKGEVRELFFDARTGEFLKDMKE